MDLPGSWDQGGWQHSSSKVKGQIISLRPRSILECGPSETCSPVPGVPGVKFRSRLCFHSCGHLAGGCPASWHCVWKAEAVSAEAPGAPVWVRGRTQESFCQSGGSATVCVARRMQMGLYGNQDTAKLVFCRLDLQYAWDGKC